MNQPLPEVDGQYECECFNCKKTFYGPKHSFTCPECNAAFKAFQELQIKDKAHELNAKVHEENKKLTTEISALQQRAEKAEARVKELEEEIENLGS